MEIAIGLMGLGLALLAIVFGYMWRTNRRYMRVLQEGQKEIVQAVRDVARIAQETNQVAQEIHEGQREMSKTLQAMYDKLKQSCP